MKLQLDKTWYEEKTAEEARCIDPTNAPQTPDPGTTDPAKEAEPQSLQEPDR